MERAWERSWAWAAKIVSANKMRGRIQADDTSWKPGMTRRIRTFSGASAAAAVMIAGAAPAMACGFNPCQPVAPIFSGCNTGCGGYGVGYGYGHGYGYRAAAVEGPAAYPYRRPYYRPYRYGYGPRAGYLPRTHYGYGPRYGYAPRHAPYYGGHRVLRRYY